MNQSTASSAESVARDAVQVGVRADSWRSAISLAAAPLVARGSIDASYVERMIASVEELGPYIVLMPGFALAHAAPGPDVHVSDLSVALLADGVSFGCDNDPVRVVMCLACTDRESHIARLQGVAEKLMEDGFLDRLCSCSTERELYELVNA